MSGNYSVEQRRQAYLKTKAGPADKVAMVLAALPALVVLIPLFIFLDNIIIIKIIGTIVGVIVYFILYSKIGRPIFKYFYAKNLKGS